MSQARWVNGVCKTCGAYTHSCKCEHPPIPEWLKESILYQPPATTQSNKTAISK